MAKELTPLQQNVLSFVRDHQRACHVTPSTRAVASKFGCAQSTARQHLEALGKKGKLEKMKDGKWGYTGPEEDEALHSAPVYGAIPAGNPTAQNEEIEGHINLDPTAFGLRRNAGKDLWILRVTGDSMVGLGILDGDLVVMQKREPVPGDVIAALADETLSTLKLYVREKGVTILRGANPRIKDITPARLEHQGVMIGLMRAMKRAA
jgi:repressor LexA